MSSIRLERAAEANKLSPNISLYMILDYLKSVDIHVGLQS